LQTTINNQKQTKEKNMFSKILLGLLIVSSLNANADTPDRDPVIARLFEKYKAADKTADPKGLEGIYVCRTFSAQPGIISSSFSEGETVTQITSFDGGLKWSKLYANDYEYYKKGRQTLKEVGVRSSAVFVDTNSGFTNSEIQNSVNKTEYFAYNRIRIMSDGSLIMQTSTVINSNSDTKELEKSKTADAKRTNAFEPFNPEEKLSSLSLCVKDN
jgi:hypothetical protein